MARPRKELNREQFEALCAMQCTLLEICDFLKVTDKTLRAWCKREYRVSFSEAYKMFSADGKISLRRAQWQAAEKGNPALLIWLGRNWLGQSENAAVLGTEKTPDDGLSASLKAFAEDMNKNAK